MSFMSCHGLVRLGLAASSTDGTTSADDVDVDFVDDESVAFACRAVTASCITNIIMQNREGTVVFPD